MKDEGPVTQSPNHPMTHSFIDSALIFAARAHDGQRRKSTDVPYIVHPVGVMLILLETGETDPELLAGALLHDTVEDTAVTLAEVRDRFGPRVAEIVAGCSEPDKSDTWENRKRHTIAFLQTAPRAVQLVSAADKLHNLRSMVTDFATHGERMWTRFNRGPRDIAWYYRSVAASLQEGELAGHPLVQQLSAAVSDFFPILGNEF